MKNEQRKFLAIGAAVGGVSTLLVTAIVCKNTTLYSGMGYSMMGGDYSRSSTQMGMNIDAHFIEQMIPHHEDAVTMSKLALTKTKKPEVKKLAQSIIESQTKEINTMNSWYQDWYGKAVPTGSDVMGAHGMMGGNGGMHMGMMGDSTDMTKLQAAADFDREFVEQMIPHHQMAVMMASMLKNGTQRAEMEQLADDIITAQTTEIDLMREWLRSW